MLSCCLIFVCPISPFNHYVQSQHSTRGPPALAYKIIYIIDPYLNFCKIQLLAYRFKHISWRLYICNVALISELKIIRWPTFYKFNRKVLQFYYSRCQTVAFPFKIIIWNVTMGMTTLVDGAYGCRAIHFTTKQTTVKSEIWSLG